MMTCSSLQRDEHLVVDIRLPRYPRIEDRAVRVRYLTSNVSHFKLINEGKIDYV